MEIIMSRLDRIVVSFLIIVVAYNWHCNQQLVERTEILRDKVQLLAKGMIELKEKSEKD